jgi:hypothetical protein
MIMGCLMISLAQCQPPKQMCGLGGVMCAKNEGRNRSQHLSKKKKNRSQHAWLMQIVKSKGPVRLSIRPSVHTRPNPAISVLHSSACRIRMIRPESASWKNNNALVLQTGPWMARQKFARSRAFDCSIALQAEVSLHRSTVQVHALSKSNNLRCTYLRYIQSTVISTFFFLHFPLKFELTIPCPMCMNRTTNTTTKQT